MPSPLAGKWRVRRRPRNLPRYWQKITPAEGIEDYARRRDWQLVLNAADIPFLLVENWQNGQIYTQPLWTGLAKNELLKYQEENRPPGRSRPFLPAAHASASLFFLVPLLFIHAVNSGWWSGPDWLPGRGVWTAAGCLDNFNIRFYDQWQRVFTALTLHADLRHLSGNILFGAIFLVMLARVAGPGRAVLLMALGGAIGNALSVFAHLPGYRSLGFSTAIFAAIGCAAGIQALAGGGKKKAAMAFGAALGLLALLGMEGENTDWVAHVMGFAAGCGLGSLYGYALRRNARLPGQVISGVIAVGLEAGAWLMAFRAVTFKLF